MLWSGFAELEVGSCGCQAYLVPSVPLRKKFTPLDARIFHLPSVVIYLSHAFQYEPPLFLACQWHFRSFRALRWCRQELPTSTFYLGNSVGSISSPLTCITMSPSGLRRLYIQVSIHGCELRADTFRQLNSLRVNLARARRE